MAYETAIVASTIGPALVLAFLSFVFPEKQGAFRFFFSWLAILFSAASFYVGYGIALINGQTALADILFALFISLLIILFVWFIIFAISVIATTLQAPIDANKEREKKDGEYIEDY